MKRKRISRRAAVLFLAAAASVAALPPQAVLAADQTWSGAGPDANWSDGLNWLGGAAPGSTSLTTSTDTATFNSAIANTWGNSAANPIVIDSSIQDIGNINFDASAGNYFIGSTTGNALLLTSGGTIQILSTLTAANAVETINAPLVLEGAGGTYSFANNSATGTGAGAGTLKFAGGITGGAAGATVLTLGGSNANANTISGVIGNGLATSLAVNKTGSGTWVLSAANTYTGGTTITGGILSIGNANNLGALSGGVSLNGGTLKTTAGVTEGTRVMTVGASGGTLNVNGGQYYFNTANTLAGSGALTLTGTGGLSGNVRLGTTQNFSGTITIGPGGGLEYNVANALPAADAITVNGDGAGSQATSGEFIASNNFTVANPITVNGGILSADNGAGAAYSGPITLGALGVQLATRDFYSLASTGRNFLVNGVISGTGGVTKLNFAGTTTLNGANTFTGATTINGGVLAINTIQNAGSTTANSLGEPSVANSTINIGTGGTLQYIGSTAGASNRTINLATPSGGTFMLDASGAAVFALSSLTTSGTSGTSTLTFAGTGAGSETAGITDGAGTNKTAVTRTGAPNGVWVLSGTNTYSGATTISGGAIEYANTGSVSPNSVVTVNAGGTLAVAVDGPNGFVSTRTGPGTVAGVFAGNIGSSGNVTYNAGANIGLDTTNVAGGALTWSGDISAVGITKLGIGTLTLPGNLGAATGVNVDAGTLVLTGNNSLSGVSSVAAGTLQLQANSGNTTGGVSSALTNSTAPGRLSLLNGSTLQLLADGTAPGNIAFAGTNAIAGLSNETVTIDVGQVSGSGGNTFTIGGPTPTPIGNAVTINVTGSTGSGDSLAFATAIDNTSGGATNLTLNPTTASVSLPGYYNFNNGTNSSTLTLGGTSAGNAVTGGIVNQGPGSTGTTGTVALTKTGASTWTLSGANTYTGATTVNAGTVIFAGAGTLPATTAITLGGGTLWALNDGAGNGGTIAQGNNVSLANNTNSTLNVGNNGSGHTGNTIAFGALSYATSNTSAATLNVTSPNGYLASFTSVALAIGGGQTANIVPNGASVLINGNVTNGITTTGATHYDTFVLDGTSAGNVITGAISDSAVYSAINAGDTRITKQNTSTWTLTGTSTYHGPTAVNGGTLALGNGGNLGATTVTVASGATFGAMPGLTGGPASGATNALGGSLTLNSGGTFSMVDGAISTLNVSGAATLNAGSNLFFEIGSATTAADLLNIAGVATDGSTVKITLTGLGSTPLTPGQYNLITAASGLTPANFLLAGSRIIAGGNAYTATLGGSATTEYVTIGSSLGAAGAYYTGNAGTTSLNATANGGATTNWSSDAAGQNDFGAQPGSAQDVYFTATSVTAPQSIASLGQSYSVNSVSFTAGAPAITITDSTNTLTVAAGINNASASNQTLGVPVILNAAQTFTNNGAGLLTVGGTLNAGANALTVTGNGNTTIGGNLSSTSTLTKTGTGTLALAGSTNSLKTLNLNSNSIVDIGSGTLNLNNAGSATIQSTTGGTINATGGGSLVISASTGTNYGDNGTANGTTLTINAPITGSNGFEVYGGSTSTGVIVLTANNTFMGDVNVDGGILSVSRIGNAGTSDTTSNLGEGTNIYLAQNGSGTLRYTGTGETTNRVINLFGTTTGGTLDQSGTGSLIFSSNFATPAAGTKTLVLQGSTSGTGTIAGIIPDNSSTNKTAVQKNGSGQWSLSGANTFSGGVTIGDNGASGAFGSLVLANSAAAGTGAINLNVANAETGQIGLVGGVTVANAATFHQRNSISSGIVNLSDANILTNTISTNAGGTYSAIEVQGGSLNLTGTAGGGVSITNGATAARIVTLLAASGSSGQISGLITDGSTGGTTAIAIGGAGTWTLAGANTYSSGTTIGSGTLLVNNTTGSGTGTGPVTLVAGGIFGGTGIILGSTASVAVNGTITAGSGPTASATPGLLATIGGSAGATTASEVWNGGGSYAWKVNPSSAPSGTVAPSNGVGTTDPAGAGGSWDMLNIATLSIASTGASPFTVNVVPTTTGALNAISPYTIADVTTGSLTVNGTTTNYANNAAGFAAALQSLQASGALVLNVPPSVANNSSYMLSAISDGGSGADIVITNFTPAPEPTSLTMLGLGAGAMLLRRRRRRRRILPMDA